MTAIRGVFFDLYDTLTICDDPEEMAVGIHDHGRSEAGAGHAPQGFLNGSVGAYGGVIGATAHDLVNGE